jgi:uncharacterized protein
MNEGQLARALTGGNAWWRDDRWERDDRDLRRAAESDLQYRPAPLDDIVAPGVYVLRGPRRVGKSLEIKRAIKALIDSDVSARRIIHFACDELERGDLRRLVTAARDTLTRGVKEPRYWFLDEITSVPGWPEAIKWLRDNTQLGDDCVVLTGSSARDLADAQKQLAGRLGPAEPSDRLLLPMSFRSFATAIGVSNLPEPEPVPPRDFIARSVDSALSELTPWLDELLSTWELYLRIGGFPRAISDYLAEGDVRAEFLKTLWDVVAGEAIRGAGATPAQVLALLGRINRSLTSPMSLESVRSDMGLGSPHTARERLNDLVFAYLTWPCHQRSAAQPKLGAQSKYYFIDPLLARIAAERSHGATAEADMSALTEQQLGIELLRSLEREEPGGFVQFTDVMYLKTSGKEVDFTGPRFGALGFEGKYVDKNWRREALTVRSQFGAGVLATRGVIDTSGDVWAVPAPFIAWLLNR